MSSPVIVALGIMLAFALLAGLALYRYGADEAIRVIVALTAFFAGPVGAFGAYFFTRTEVTTARTEATAARNLAAEYQAQVRSVSNTAAEAKVTLVDTIDSKPPTYTVGELKTDQGFKDAVMKLSSVQNAGYGEIQWMGPRRDRPEQQKK